MESVRIFRARKKIDSPGVISHITQRAPGVEVLFLEEADYLFMLHLIKETAGKFSQQIFSFVLMPNHIHLLLRQLDGNLKVAMKNLFERYANYFNAKYERKGHVFCGAYRQAVCQDENYLFAITVYIHINPARANLVDDPLNYRWSSIRPYVMPVKGETFLNYNFVLNILNNDINRAREIYKDLIRNALLIKVDDVLEDQKAIDLFKSKVLGALVKSKDVLDVEIDKKAEEIRSKKWQKGPHEREAKKYLIQQLISRGYKVPEIADKLGVSRQNIYRYT